MKQFLSHNTTQKVINLSIALIVWASLIIGFIGGAQDHFVWLYLTSIVCVITFLIYNGWVSDYLNRERYNN